MSDKARILCVDDEPKVLSALKRQLHREFEVHTCDNARDGIATLFREGPFEVVISDYRMPQIDGVSMLSKMREKCPSVTRILLTGYADADAASKAVNRGQVFRFLNKPCEKDDLVAAIRAGVEQHRLMTAEKELLEQTLRGAVRTLTDIISLASPVAFSRADRARATCLQICEILGLDDVWTIEMAAQLSQIGFITLDEETVRKLHFGADLDADEQEAVSKAPELALQLLENIPRIEPILDILRDLGTDFSRGHVKNSEENRIPIGARILRAALDYDSLELRGLLGAKAIAVMRGREGVYDPQVLEALTSLRSWDDKGRELRELMVKDLGTGMILAEDVKSRSGALLLARGQEITEPLLVRLRGFSNNTSVGVVEPLLIAVPLEDPAEENEPLARTIHDSELTGQESA